MRQVKQIFTMLAVAAGAAVVWSGANALVKDVQFARAEQEVQVTRAQLQNVQDLSTVFRQVAKVVEPSVVMIEVKKSVHMTMNGGPEQLRKFFPNLVPDPDSDSPNDTPDPQQQIETGEGSGVIMETDGSTAYVLTNNHVAGGASEMHLTLADGRIIDNAKLVGADPKSDVAVVKFSADHLVPAKWGDSDTLEKGDLILAFGSPFGYVGSMTHGIVSALNRDQVGIIGSQMAYENFIQVDAPINPGNSGGPLVDLHGDVVGINTAIASRTGAFNGIGFAIPSNMAHTVYDQLKSKGKVTRGWLGVEIANVGTPEIRDMAKANGYNGDSGIFVRQVISGTPSTGKLRPGDVITELDGKEVTTSSQLRNKIAVTPPGNTVKLTVFREGKNQEVDVKIGEQPEDLQSRIAGGHHRVDPDDNTASADSLGIRLATATQDELDRFGLSNVEGALITQVDPNGLGAMNGLHTGDVITRIGDTTVKSAHDAADALAKQDMTKGVRLFVTSKDGERLVFIGARTKDE